MLAGELCWHCPDCESQPSSNPSKWWVLKHFTGGIDHSLLIEVRYYCPCFMSSVVSVGLFSSWVWCQFYFADVMNKNLVHNL